MANKKEMIVIGAAVAAALGGYILKESDFFQKDTAEDVPKKDATGISGAIENIKDKIMDDKDDSEEKKSQTTGFVDKIKEKFDDSREKTEELVDDMKEKVEEKSEGFVDKVKDKMCGSPEKDEDKKKSK